MSRALRKLQENDISKLEQIVNISDEEKEEKVNKKKKKKLPKSGNVFDLLDEEENKLEEEEQEKNEDMRLEEEVDMPQEVVKKKKKKKKKKKINQNEDISLNGDELDEIDRSIKEVNQILGVTSLAVTTKPKDTSDDQSNILRNKSILSVDARNLNPDNEMKRKFGNAVIQNERRRNPHERRFKRATSLVVPRQNWPPYHKVGINMVQVKNDESNLKSSKLFAFKHQEMYQKVQFMFYDAVESLDHNNIMALVNTHPYHVDSLLQLSEVCRINEDYQMAAELIERALFVFECSFHTLFNITLGECRLEYRRSENRPFFLALFRQIKYVGEKACYRTALEFCKVLLGLDPHEDPLCVLLLMDYYAIKAEQYSYFIQLRDELEIVRRVSLLPNFAYSYALAKFYNEDEAEADKALQKALVTFPSLVVELMNQCGISLDDKIKNHPLFDPVSHLTQSLSLNQLISLYVGRCYSLWKPPEILDWLAKNCIYVIENEKDFKKDIDEAKVIRETRYKKSPRNVLRHIIISDIKEATKHLPPEVRNQAVMTHDPLPPSDSVTGYERPRAPNRHDNEGMLSMFLQSLLPSYNPNQPANNERNIPNHAELINEARAMDLNQETVQNAIQDGAARLMDAMRELLNTMTYRNDGEEGRNMEEDENQWEDEEQQD